MLATRSNSQIVEVEVVKPEIVYKTEYIEVPANNAFYKNITLTDSDLELLAKVLFLEAGNQSITGQRAVVEVIFNRMLDSRFPDTLSGVIYAKNQFSVVGSLRAAKPTQTQYDVISTVLEENVPVLPENVVYFATTPVNGTYYDKIGGHCFGY